MSALAPTLLTLHSYCFSLGLLFFPGLVAPVLGPRRHRVGHASAHQRRTGPGQGPERAVLVPGVVAGGAAGDAFAGDGVRGREAACVSSRSSYPASRMATIARFAKPAHD